MRIKIDTINLIFKRIYVHNINLPTIATIGELYQNYFSKCISNAVDNIVGRYLHFPLRPTYLWRARTIISQDGTYNVSFLTNCTGNNIIIIFTLINKNFSIRSSVSTNNVFGNSVFHEYMEVGVITTMLFIEYILKIYVTYDQLFNYVYYDKIMYTIQNVLVYRPCGRCLFPPPPVLLAF